MDGVVAQIKLGEVDQGLEAFDRADQVLAQTQILRKHAKARTQVKIEPKSIALNRMQTQLLNMMILIVLACAYREVDELGKALDLAQSTLVAVQLLSSVVVHHQCLPIEPVTQIAS